MINYIGINYMGLYDFSTCRECTPKYAQHLVVSLGEGVVLKKDWRII